MTCAEVVEWLLEADPETVAGLGDFPATAHLRACEECRRLATRLVAAHQQDSADYLGVASRRTPKEITALVMAAPHSPRAVPSRQRKMLRIAAALLPLAAAASFLLVANARRQARHEAFQASIDAAFAAATPVTSVKVPAGRNAVVFKTRDPQISVVWIY